MSTTNKPVPMNDLVDNYINEVFAERSEEERERLARAFRDGQASEYEPFTSDGKKIPGGVRERKVENLCETAQVPKDMRTADLATTCRWMAGCDEREKAYHACRQLATQGFVESRGEKRSSIVLTGEYGVGKSYLATGAFIELALRKGGGRWRSLPALIASLQSSYGTNQEMDLDKYALAPVLLLDDMGQADVHETDDRRRLFSIIIDERKSWQRPTIITSNLGSAGIQREFGERIFNRLYEMAAWHKVGGRNLRIHPEDKEESSDE